MDVIAKLKLADWHMIFKLDSPVTTDYQSHNNYTVMNSV